MFHLRGTPARAARCEPLPDEHSAWIRDRRLPFDSYAVGSLVPAVFERYVRILNPALGPLGERVTWAAVAAWSGRAAHALAQWEFVAAPRDGVGGPAPFTTPPPDGALARPAFDLLCGVLAAATSTPDRCFAGVWSGYGSVATLRGAEWRELALDERSFLVTEARVGAAGLLDWAASARDAGIEVPTLLWPADRAWFVAADVDLDSTYVGCTKTVAEAVLNEPGLEAWPVLSRDLVSIAADEVNA